LISTFTEQSALSAGNGKGKNIFHLPISGGDIPFLLIAGVFISIFFNIKFLLRSIILVVFFLTFVSKIFILPFLIADDLRRLMVWISRKLKRQEITEQNKTSGIPRSEFLIKAGTLVAAIPLHLSPTVLFQVPTTIGLNAGHFIFQTCQKHLMELNSDSFRTFIRAASMTARPLSGVLICY
jgi:hypothetical protein